LDEDYYTKPVSPSKKRTKTLRNPHILLTNSLTTFQKKNLTEIYKKKWQKMAKNGKKWQKNIQKMDEIVKNKRFFWTSEKINELINLLRK